MKLATEIKLKNEQLILQRAELQKQFFVRLNAPNFRSYFVTFIAIPFLAGAIVKLSNTIRPMTLLRLYRLAILA